MYMQRPIGKETHRILKTSPNAAKCYFKAMFNKSLRRDSGNFPNNVWRQQIAAFIANIEFKDFDIIALCKFSKLLLFKQ